ncbi:MAG: ferritin family protein, partial [Oscillospiraceae bacterium]|nr:ferritin family protein [Oscillospiraceae bacterium]
MEQELSHVLAMQQNEIDEHHIYSRLAKRVKNEKDAATLQQIADEEKGHAALWSTLTGKTLKPRR